MMLIVMMVTVMAMKAMTIMKTLMIIKTMLVCNSGSAPCPPYIAASVAPIPSLVMMMTMMSMKAMLVCDSGFIAPYRPPMYHLLLLPILLPAFNVSIVNYEKLHLT